MSTIQGIRERVSALGSEIESAKSERSELRGAEKQHLAQLEKEFGVKDLDKGKVELLKEKGVMDALEGKIQKGFKKLEEDYEW